MNMVSGSNAISSKVSLEGSGGRVSFDTTTRGPRSAVDILLAIAAITWAAEIEKPSHRIRIDLFSEPITEGLGVGRLCRVPPSNWTGGGIFFCRVGRCAFYHQNIPPKIAITISITRKSPHPMKTSPKSSVPSNNKPQIKRTSTVMANGIYAQ